MYERDKRLNPEMDVSGNHGFDRTRPAIREEELDFETGTSAGPGGQNVNRVQSRVTVCFNVGESSTLSDVQKERILERLANRINKEGILKVRSQRHRTQRMNRSAAIERLCDLLGQALYEPPERRKRKVARAVREKRLEEKRKRSRLKKTRGQPKLDQDHS